MKSSRVNRLNGAFFWALYAVLLVSWSATVTRSQSSDQGFPTAVTENQLSGTIKARDIGDSRLTTYYYTFSAAQGDLFINIITKNLNGSVYIFTADNLRPLGQILVYADLSASETGRVIYFRKPEKLLLRVEGRSPNDEAAEFQLKFAGSFVAAAATDEPGAPKVSSTALENDSGVRVNSVGTIVAVTPKPKPTPKGTTETEKAAEKTAPEPKVTEATKSEPETNRAGKERTEAKSSEEATLVDEKRKPVAARRTVRRTKPSPLPKKETAVATNDEPKAADQPERPPVLAPAKNSAKPKVVVTDNVKAAAPDPLARINLVVLFKDGTKIERPMNEVLRFSVDRGILTVVAKDGTTAKYSIFEVTSVTIQ